MMVTSQPGLGYLCDVREMNQPHVFQCPDQRRDLIKFARGPGWLGLVTTEG